MNIVQVMAHDGVGGVQRIAHLLSQGLSVRGHRIDTWALYRREGIPGIQADVLMPHKPRGSDYLHIAAELRQRLRRARPDAVISHMPLSGVLTQGCAAAQRVPTRLAVQHGMPAAYSSAARRLDQFAGQTGVYTSIAAVSQTVADAFAGYPSAYRRRIRVVRNALPEPDPPRKAFNARIQLGLPSSALLLVSVGRLVPGKNPGVLLPIVQALPFAHLAFVGDGELRPELQARAVGLGISERVHFLGERTAEEAFVYLQAAAVSLFPSTSEGLGLIVLETLWARTPLVASDIPAIREAAGGGAVLVSPTDPNEWVEAVRRVLATPALAQQLVQRGTRTLQQYSVDAMIAQYERLLV